MPTESLTLDSDRCLIVAEVGQAHDGSLGTAHAFIDAAARAGAHAVKFQTHIAEAETTLAEPWRVHFSYQDTTRFDYWKRMEFSEAQWVGLREHAENCGMSFISSPFSLEAADLLDRVGVAAWKVASGEVSNWPLLERVASDERPVILSSGMSSLWEMDKAVETVRAYGGPLAVLQCTSSYPCPPEQVGLEVINHLRSRYRLPVGLSDHSGVIYSGLAAATMGISVLEVHITLSREMFGPDVPASLTTLEFAQLVEGISFIERMKRNPVDKEAMASALEPIRGLFSKSLVAARDLEEGVVLIEEHLALKKPGHGLPADRYNDVIGRRLRKSLGADEALTEEHLEERE